MIMNKLNIIRIILKIFEECGYTDDFSINCISDYIIITITINTHCISRILNINEIMMCEDPRYMIESTINNMIDEMRYYK